MKTVSEINVDHRFKVICQHNIYKIVPIALRGHEASEAMANSKCKWPSRSHIASDLNSLTSITYVPGSKWPQTTRIPQVSPGKQKKKETAKYHPLTCVASLASKNFT